MTLRPVVEFKIIAAPSYQVQENELYKRNTRRVKQ